MKLRLSPNKTIVRITTEEWAVLRQTQELTQKFWLSDIKQLEVKLNLTESAGYKSSEVGFTVNLPIIDFTEQKTKKDQAWELSVNDQFKVSVEVDLVKEKRAEI